MKGVNEVTLKTGTKKNPVTLQPFSGREAFPRPSKDEEVTGERLRRALGHFIHHRPITIDGFKSLCNTWEFPRSTNGCWPWRRAIMDTPHRQEVTHSFFNRQKAHVEGNPSSPMIRLDPGVSHSPETCAVLRTANIYEVKKTKVLLSQENEFDDDD